MISVCIQSSVFPFSCNGFIKKYAFKDRLPSDVLHRSTNISPGIPSKCNDTIQDFAPSTAPPESLSNLGIPLPIDVVHRTTNISPGLPRKCYDTIQDFAPTTAPPESLSNLGIPSNSWSWGRMLKTLKQEKRIWFLRKLY